MATWQLEVLDNNNCNVFCCHGFTSKLTIDQLDLPFCIGTNLTFHNELIKIF